jgi:hypothetical protein
MLRCITDSKVLLILVRVITIIQNMKSKVICHLPNLKLAQIQLLSIKIGVNNHTNNLNMKLIDL